MESKNRISLLRFEGMNPSKLLMNERFNHATCGMSRETVALLRIASKETKKGDETSAYQEFANNMVGLIGGIKAAVIVAPPVGPVICCAMNNSEESTSIDATSFDVIIWFLLDITDIDSKQTTFINTDSSTEMLMSSLYRLAPSGGMVECNHISSSASLTPTSSATPSSATASSAAAVDTDNKQDESDELVAYDHTGRVIDEMELSMLRSANMLGGIQFMKKSACKVRADEDVEIDEWTEKVQNLVNLPCYKTRERELPCLIIPGLYLSSAKEARSKETLNKNKITHIFSCIDQCQDDLQKRDKTRKICEDADIKFEGIWSLDENETDMIGQHYETFKHFIEPILKPAENIAPSSSNRVLVHCEQGVNRSGLLVVAYVMTSLKMPILKALELCLEARGPLLWNIGFQRQLVMLAKKEGLLVSE